MIAVSYKKQVLKWAFAEYVNILLQGAKVFLVWCTYRNDILPFKRTTPRNFFYKNTLYKNNKA